MKRGIKPLNWKAVKEMNERLLHIKDIVEEYGLSRYEIQTMLNQVPKINIGRGKQVPRWVVKQSDIKAYLEKRKSERFGMDKLGRILRRH